jgi:integrase
MAGRKRTGTLVPTGAGYSARFANGKLIPLHTSDPTLARVRLAELARGTIAPEPGGENFREACLRVIAELEREGKGRAATKERLSRLKRYVWDWRADPTATPFGELKVTAIASSQVTAVLAAAAATGQIGRESMGHLHTDIHKVFAVLVQDDQLPTNPARAEKVRIPKLKRDKRRRVLLTDDEFVAFVTYHLDPNRPPALPGPKGGRPVDPARQVVSRRQLAVMALVSRCFGGLRPSDIHAWTYEDIDLVGWKWADAPRPKTEHSDDDGAELERQRIALPPPVAAVLFGWWVDAGRPTTGLVFPEQKASYARDLRRALKEAGVMRAELHADGTRTRQTDFYSFRRAWVTSVGRAGVNAQTAMLSTGHKSMTTHMRYNVPDVLELPAGALPAALFAAASDDAFNVALEQFDPR